MESFRESCGRASALDCRIVRQRRFTSSLRLTSLARNLPTLSYTASLVPRHRLPVASSLAQPQTASSALKSGLYPGRFTSRRFSPGLLRSSLTASPRCAGALSQITFSRPPCLFRNCSRKAADGRQQTFRCCCCPPTPSTPPRPSPGTPPNNLSSGRL